MLRRLIGSVLLGVVVGFLAWLLGMDAPHAIGLGGVLIALAVCLSVLGDQADVGWPAPEPALRPGSRRDIAQLGWSIAARARGLRGGGHVSSDAVRRLRTLATEALALSGVDLDDPTDGDDVRRLLGDGAPALLRRGSAAAPTTTEFIAVLSRVEGLADTVDRGGG
jgi:hypothetical protein